MGQTKYGRSALSLVALLMAGLLALPSPGLAQLGGLLPPIGSSPTTSTITGDAAAVRATLFGALGLLTTTMALADTGTLSGVNDARDASLDTGTVPSVLTGEVLSAGTISWPDEVDSAVSLANLNLGLAGIGITADSVVAQASQVAVAAGTGSTTIDNLLVNGTPVAITGAPNQIVGIPGGQIVINEQSISSTGTAVVNAIHVTVTGVADVVIASATAGIA